MNWLVCSDRDSRKFTVMSRMEREFLLDIWMELGDGVPTRVLKKFEKKKDAQNYVKQMKLTNKTIENL